MSTSKTLKSFSTLRKLLTCRGFKAPDSFQKNFRLKKKSELIEVQYIDELRLNSKKLTTRVETVFANLTASEKKKDITLVFIMNDTKLTPTLKDTVKILRQKYKIFLQIFPIQNLMFDITTHAMCPEHTRITKSEYNEFLVDFLDSFHIDSLDRLPKILESDPVAMFIGLREGELCKIRRPSRAAGYVDVYRLCVK